MNRTNRKHTKRAIILAIIITIAIFPINSLAKAKEFLDMKGHWAETYVAALVEKGGIAGMPDGLFHPSESMTFPQFVKIIVGNVYGDIEPIDSNWASGYMQKAMEIGIITPEDIEKSEAITRFEAVKIVHEALRNIYNETDVEDAYVYVRKFEDYPSCKSCRGPFEGEIAQCYIKGIITGKPGTVTYDDYGVEIERHQGPLFDGEAGLTRAEGSIIIMKMIDPALRTPPPPPSDDEDVT